jgi:uncharacterized protein YegL
MKDLIEIVVVSDRSGSMCSMRDEAIGAFNAFLESQQKLPGQALMTYVQFDNEYEIVFSGKPLRHVEPLTRATYEPRGSTALMDAIGKTIDEVGQRLARTPESERPNKVLFIILTDGEENASQRYTREQIRSMMDHQRSQYSWEFVFLAAGPDALKEAVATGVGTRSTYSYSPEAGQLFVAAAALSANTGRLRSGDQNVNWSNPNDQNAGNIVIP